MSVSFNVSASSGAYDVSIDFGAFDRALEAAEDLVVISDAYFAARIEARGHQVISINATEAAKSLDGMPEIISMLRTLGASRKTTLLAVGGGVVQDVAGFIASIYMRGMPWIYMPTTLLGMSDSCIGGKSSINVGRYKNIVGTFYPPKLISIDPALTATLSAEQRVAGLAEAAKITFCRGDDAFTSYTRLAPTIHSEPEELAKVVELSLESKKWFIEVDEFDRGERLLLNFGHTFGHAIETASNFKISHGVAVALGVLAAVKFGTLLGRSHLPDNRVHAFISHISTLLGAVPGLAAEVAAMSLPELMDAFDTDKKHTKSHYALIVVRENGEVERLLLERDKRASDLVSAAFAAILEQFGL
jgi:3-dehydroquinate synthase